MSISSSGYSFGLSTSDFGRIVTMPIYDTAPAVPDFKPGDEIEVTLTARVADNRYTAESDFEYTGDAGARSLYATDRRVTRLRVTKKAKQPPTWKAGDVITVRFNPYGSLYTYVRGSKDWPGETVKLGDARVDELFRDGRVRHLAREGSVVTS